MKPDRTMSLAQHPESLPSTSPRHAGSSSWTIRIGVRLARLLTSPWFSFVLATLSFLVFLMRMVPASSGVVDYRGVAGPAFATLTFAVVGWVMIVIRHDLRGDRAEVE